MSDEDDDVLLTGLIDGELDQQSGKALKARLEAEPWLRARLKAIEAGGLPFAPAFAALLDEAPIERMKAAAAAIAQPSSRWGNSARALAASVAIVTFLAGIGIGWVAPHLEDWRDAVAEYAALYTPETFAHAPTGEAIQAPALRLVGSKLGIDLPPEVTKIDGLSFKTAILLAYEGKPLGQLAYADAQGSPVLFCIIADSRHDAAPMNESRNNFALTTWAHGGRGFMVIAQLPAQKVAEIARQMERLF